MLVIWLPSLPIRVPSDPVGGHGDPDRGSADGSGPADPLVIDDPAGGTTWIVDAEFLGSPHRCIYGNGCQGIGERRAPELALGCCSVGAELVDEDDVQTVVRSFVRLDPVLMQYHDEARRRGFLTPTRDGRTATRIVEGACIFLNRPGFAAGIGCALHLGALADGERPLDRKPNVCWQLPLRVETHEGGGSRPTVVLRRWTRDDWGGPLAWWCTEAGEAPGAFTGDEPVVVTNRDELVEIVGDEVYDLIRQALSRRRGQSS